MPIPNTSNRNKAAINTSFLALFFLRLSLKNNLCICVFWEGDEHVSTKSGKFRRGLWTPEAELIGGCELFCVGAGHWNLVFWRVARALGTVPSLQLSFSFVRGRLNLMFSTPPFWHDSSIARTSELLPVSPLACVQVNRLFHSWVKRPTSGFTWKELAWAKRKSGLKSTDKYNS